MRDLISCVRARVLRPLDLPWAAVAPRLRELRDHSHRALNAGLVAARLTDAVRREDGATPRATLVGRAVRDGLAPIAAPSVIVDASASAAARLYAARRREILRGDQSMPSYRYPAPILVRDRGWSVSVEPDPECGGERVVVVVKLAAGSSAAAPAVRFVLGPPDKSRKRRALRSSAPWWAAVRQMAAASTARGDLKLIWDRRKHHWLAVMSRHHQVEERDPAHCLGVHLGMVVPIEVATAGEERAAIGDARALWEYRAREADIRKRLGQTARGKKWSPGVGGGRGWERRHRAVASIEDREDRWLRSLCQMVAARVVKLALRWRRGTLALGDYERGNGPVARARAQDADERERVEEHVLFWQPARLLAAIEWAARKSGLATIRVPERGASMTCASCGREDKASRISRAVFRCTRCGVEMDAEVNAARNLALRGEAALAREHAAVPS